MFSLLHPTNSFVSFVSINGSEHEVWPESGEQLFEGDLRPNGMSYFFSFSYFIKQKKPQLSRHSSLLV